MPELSTNEVDLIALRIYPNPTQGTIQINWVSSLDELIFELIDFSGKTVHQKQTITKGESISVAHLANGLYFLTLTADNLSKTVKVIKH